MSVPRRPPLFAGLGYDLGIRDHVRLEYERRRALKAAHGLDAAGSEAGAREARLRVIALHVRAQLNSGPRVAALLDALTGWMADEGVTAAALGRLIARLDEIDRDEEERT